MGRCAELLLLGQQINNGTLFVAGIQPNLLRGMARLLAERAVKPAGVNVNVFALLVDGHLVRLPLLAPGFFLLLAQCTVNGNNDEDQQTKRPSIR